MNIVFIVSDTFRRDNLGCYGDKAVRTPHLDQLAKKCFVFDRCYADSFPTMPARADIFTGKWTYTYLGWAPLPREETVLASVMRRAGYTTKAVVDTPFFVRGGYNYDRGFMDFTEIQGQGTNRLDINMQRRYETDYCAPATMLEAERWLQRHRKEKFFLYVDAWDPHEPWDPPDWYVELYYPKYDGKQIFPIYWDWKEQGMTEEDLKVAYACYCGEVTMVDRWVGRLLDTVESMNLMEDTAIIFTTDHGFYFGEHRIFGKTIMDMRAVAFYPSIPSRLYRSPLYEEVAHIPLLIHVPGVKAQRSDSMVSLADLMPTVLELAGVEIPKTVQAKSVVPVLKGEERTEPDFAVTTHPLYNPGEVTRMVDMMERLVAEPLPSTITAKEWSLLYASEGQPAELYHLPSDPKQEKNLIQEEPEIAKDLLAKFVSRLEKAGTEARLLAPRRRF